MKKIILVSSIFLACATQAFAQITESSYVLGASSSFFMATNPNGKADQLSFSIQPVAGKFISEKWLMNVGVGYSFRRLMSSFNPAQLHTTSNTFSGMFGMTRFYPISEKMYWTLDYSIGGGYILNDNQYILDSNVVDSRSTGFVGTLSASPGLSYFVNKKWMLFSSFGALRYTYDVSFNVFSARHTLGYNFQANSFGIGAKYIFGTENK